MTHSVRIIAANPDLGALELSWSTPVFTDEDGIGSLTSLHEAGDAFVAVGMTEAAGTTIVGSGVMVAPGMVLTATHVLDEIEEKGGHPLLLSFLPDAARAWLPIDVSTLTGPSEFYPDRTVSSDITLVSCSLNSDALAPAPLRLAPMKVALPLLGDRLWAVGFRHQLIENGAAYVSPMISSGVVTQAFPMGRGERMPSPCFEVAMETIGGMSGGAVMNAQGEVVGIVSSSPDGGPSYMTLIWDALRLRVTGPIPKLKATEKVSLLGAKAVGLARLSGDVDRNPWGEVTFNLTPEEAELFASSAAIATPVEDGRHVLSRDERDDFAEEWGSELEDEGALAVVMALTRFSLAKMADFLQAAGAPAHLLTEVSGFTVEDFEGVEDLELIRAERRPDGKTDVEFFLRMQTLVWTLEMPAAFQAANAQAMTGKFFNLTVEGDVARMEFIHRAYFRIETVLVPDAGVFTDMIVTSSALIPSRRSR
ncbi:serine protease [Brevundimonas sp.]|uniref:S1 family peptidase n=1 Tax=Brevundimonas sp. TaxID=1871086 RepID=UPI0028AF2ADB|nr:serine protease [Brevundimonas sp.]